MKIFNLHSAVLLITSFALSTAQSCSYDFVGQRENAPLFLQAVTTSRFGLIFRPGRFDFGNGTGQVSPISPQIQNSSLTNGVEVIKFELIAPVKGNITLEDGKSMYIGCAGDKIDEKGKLRGKTCSQSHKSF
jgi:hypothetical protein